MVGKPSQQNLLFGAVLFVFSLSTYEVRVVFRVIWIHFLSPPLSVVVCSFEIYPGSPGSCVSICTPFFMIPPAPMLVDFLLL